ncbi:MAG: HAD family hydrolase [Candidatus Coproplasma sp.]
MKNFAFDLYGTLIKIRTDENLPTFRKKIAARFNKLCGKEIDFWTEYDNIFGAVAAEDEADFIEVISRIAARHGVEIEKEKLAAFALRFRRASTLRIGVYKGVRKTLKSLKNAGARLYILSNAQSSFTLNEIKRCRLTKYFDGIELSSDFGKKKPSKEFFRHLAQKYNLDLKDTVYTGNDYVCDILSSKSLGMKSVYVHTDISPNQDDFDAVKQTADFASDGDFYSVGKYLLSLTEN